MAGGSGTRLWPLSRKDLPKQIQKLVSDKTLIEDTVDRISDVVDYANIFISTTQNYADKIRATLPLVPADNIIVEPVAHGPTAAFGLLAETLYRRDPEATIFSLASDHAISEVDQFQAAMHEAFSVIEKNPRSIALVGIKPTRPDTGLGYVKIDQEIQHDPLVYSVEKFVEKPGLKVATSYFASGDYYWNAAYYCFKAKTLVDAYDESNPLIMAGVRNFLASNDQADFVAIPPVAHEIEIINAQKFPLLLIPAHFKWSDIGNWGTLHDLLAEYEDEKNMVVNSKQNYIGVDSTNCMVIAKNDNKVVATVGLNNIVIVDTKDALLVLDKAHTHDVKAVLESLQNRGLMEYL